MPAAQTSTYYGSANIQLIEISQLIMPTINREIELIIAEALNLLNFPLFLQFQCLLIISIQRSQNHENKTHENCLHNGVACI